MTVRSGGRAANPLIHHSARNESPAVHTNPRAIARVLGRAYPLVKQLAEILELEAEFDRDVAMLATDAKRIRRAIGELLARSGVAVNASFKEKDAR